MQQDKQLVGSSGTGPQRQLAIPAGIEMLDREITRIEEAFSALHDRMISVRRNEPMDASENIKEKKDPERCSCELAEALRQHTARIRNLRDRIEYNLSVLEI